MQESRITFSFTGGTADRDWLDGSDAVRYTEAARQLLALNAYFYTTGTVPRGGALNETRAYRVFKSAPQAACYAEMWTVAVIGGALATIVGTLGLRALDYTYERFLKDSLGPIILGRPSSMPPEMRGPDVLSAQDSRNAPVFETEHEREQRWGQLRERATLIIPNVARPVGRSATKLTITSRDIDAPIGVIDLDALRRLMADAQAYKEAAITTALGELRLRPVHAQLG